ncbi:hypothetical protein NDU88_001288 [Pleurodeles waltl]|uniref:Uncharacterized protein n=1 Tax=Pleurodeles waltl TaxID=8319 RepID=A0AAV7LZ64_PLEWA|nr:hypothetical protein NDU88_001288 [Pleurodeles waltl]
MSHLLTRILRSCPRHLPLAEVAGWCTGFPFSPRRNSGAALSVPSGEFQVWPRFVTSLGLRASVLVALRGSGFSLPLHFLLSAMSLLLTRILRSCPSHFPLAEVGSWCTGFPFSPRRDSGAAPSGKELRVRAVLASPQRGRLSDADAMLDLGDHGESSLFSPRLSGRCC